MLPSAGIPTRAILAKYASRGVAGLGFEATGGGYSMSSFWQDITRGGLDIARAVFTPPAYQSTGPSGSTTIRIPGATGSPTPAPGERPGYPTAPSIFGMSTGTAIAVGLAAVVGIVLITRR
jgi:hypothetical protein